MAASAELLVAQTALPSTPIGSSLLTVRGNQTIVGHPATDKTSEPVGIAFLGSFYAGHRHVFRVWLRHGSADVIRIEVHGSISRMSKIAAHIARDGSAPQRGEEVDGLVVTRVDEGLEVELSFRAFSTAVEWIFLFGLESRDHAGPVFSTSTASLVPKVEARSFAVRHLPLRQFNSVLAICQSFTLLDNVFNLRFEIAKPGSRLLGLRVSTELQLAHVHWWTWEIDDLRPDPGELVAQRPMYPVRSPALMDRFGPGHANAGHVISGIYADGYDASRLSVVEAARLANLTLRARYDCGTIYELPIESIMANEESVPRSHALFQAHLARCLGNAAEKPVFLEVGANGPASALVRQRVEPAWTYIGLDHRWNENVDLVGDAHRLSDIIAAGSVEMIYSSEVMEHLLSPLRFVLEANRVLKRGGTFIARMPTIWPLHAEPWDYWRITQHGWTSLLNANTGFEILDQCEDGWASVVPHHPDPRSGILLMASAPAPMLTMVVARKIGEVEKDTSGWSPDLAKGSYDHA